VDIVLGAWDMTTRGVLVAAKGGASTVVTCTTVYSIQTMVSRARDRGIVDEAARDLVRLDMLLGDLVRPSRGARKNLKAAVWDLVRPQELLQDLDRPKMAAL